MKPAITKLYGYLLAMLTFVLLIFFNNCSPSKFQGDGGSTTVPNPDTVEFKSAVQASLHIADAFCKKHVEAGLIQASAKESCYNSFLADDRPLNLLCRNCVSNSIAALAAAHPSVTNSITFDRDRSEMCFSALLTDTQAVNFALTSNEYFSFDYLSDFVRRTPVCSQFIIDEFPDGYPPTAVRCIPSYPVIGMNWVGRSSGEWPYYGSSVIPGPLYSVGLGQTLSIRFVTPASIQPPGYGTFLGPSFGGDGNGIRQITISETEGCVDSTQLAAPCTSTGREASVSWSFIANRPAQCGLKPNTAYYYNITYGDSTDCSSGGPCCLAGDSICRAKLQNEMR